MFIFLKKSVQLTLQNERWSMVLKASFAMSIFLETLDRKTCCGVCFSDILVSHGFVTHDLKYQDQ